MNSKIIYVDFRKTSKKSKRYLKGNNLSHENYKTSYLIKIIDKIKSLFHYSNNKGYKTRENVTYKHWL